jgi:hypothetical protein
VVFKINMESLLTSDKSGTKILRSEIYLVILAAGSAMALDQVIVSFAKIAFLSCLEVNATLSAQLKHLSTSTIRLLSRRRSGKHPFASLSALLETILIPSPSNVFSAIWIARPAIVQRFVVVKLAIQ